MKHHRIPLATFALGIIATPKLPAQLPILNDPPFLGYFAGSENKSLRIGIDSTGGAFLSPQNNRGELARKEDSVSMTFVVETTNSDGTIQRKSFDPTTLETTQSPTDKLGKVTFRGKFPGDALVEVTVEHSRGVVTLGGKLMDPGKLNDQPPRFAIHLRMPKFDPSKIKPSGTFSKDKDKDGKEKKKSRSEERKEKEAAGMLTLERPGGQPLKLDFHDRHDLASKELNGEGTSKINVEMGLYQTKGIQFTASPNSSLFLWNREPTRLADGYTIRWVPESHIHTEVIPTLQIRIR
jgi:hypothetical protein